MRDVKIKVQKIHEDAEVPTFAKQGDAGFDLYSVEEVWIDPGETVIVPTGLKFEIPPMHEVQIRPRSGLSLKTGLRVANAPGTIDSGYRGEVGVIIENSSSEEFLVEKGMRVAQGVLSRVPPAKFEMVEEVEESERGEGGFGSTGTK